MDEVGFELGKIVKKMRENKGQRKIEDFFIGERALGVVKSRRLQIAIKGIKKGEEEKKEEEKKEEKEEEEMEKIEQELGELEQLNRFQFKRRKL